MEVLIALRRGGNHLGIRLQPCLIVGHILVDVGSQVEDVARLIQFRKGAAEVGHAHHIRVGLGGNQQAQVVGLLAGGRHLEAHQHPLLRAVRGLKGLVVGNIAHHGVILIVQVILRAFTLVQQIGEGTQRRIAFVFKGRSALGRGHRPVQLGQFGMVRPVENIDHRDQQQADENHLHDLLEAEFSFHILPSFHDQPLTPPCS